MVTHTQVGSPLPFSPSAPVSHAGLLSVCRTYQACSCFKAAELPLPSAWFAPPSGHPMACDSLLVLSSHVTTKSSLPVLDHSLTQYPDGFSSWLLSLSYVIWMIHLLVFSVCLGSQPSALWKQKPWLLLVYQHLVHTSCSINTCCMEVSGTSMRDGRALHDWSEGQMIQVSENAL